MNNQTEIVARPSTFAITRTFAALMERGAEGFDTDDAIAAWQDELSQALELAGDKWIGCRVVIAKAASDEAFYKAEAQRLLDHANRLAAVQERVKDLALHMLLATGQDKLETADGSWVKVARRKSKSVLVTDESWLPESCIRRTAAPDKTAIKKAIESGETIPGAEIVENESTSIQWGGK